MMIQRRLPGFSLVELLVAVGIAVVVLGGLVKTFSDITKSTANANRASDMTSVTRGVAQLLEYDLSQTGRGISDVSALNVHYKFIPPPTGIVDEAVPQLSLYGLADLDHDGSFSEVTLQWFDYDMAGTSGVSNPTFVVDFGDLQGLLTDPLSNFNGSAMLISNNLAALRGVAEGDIFLFYKYRVFNEIEKFQTDAIWNAGLVDALGNSDIEAFILQIGSVQTPDTDTSGLGMDYEMEITFSDDSIFERDLGSYAAETLFRAYSLVLTTEVRTELKLPSALFLARKLGDSDSFNRVNYFVESRGGNNVLIRSHNGVEEVVATNVAKFDVSAGLDVTNKAPDDILIEDMDGYVTALDADFWAMSFSDWGGSMTVEEYRRILGRHTMAVQVDFSVESLTKDFSDADAGGSGGHKIRSFSRQFRLWNNSMPIPNL